MATNYERPGNSLKGRVDNIALKALQINNLGDYIKGVYTRIPNQLTRGVALSPYREMPVTPIDKDTAFKKSLGLTSPVDRSISVNAQIEGLKQQSLFKKVYESIVK